MSKYKSILFYIDGVKSKEQMVSTYLDYMRDCQGFDEEMAVLPSDEVVHAVCLIQALKGVRPSEITDYLRNKYDVITEAETLVLSHIATGKSFDSALFAKPMVEKGLEPPFDNGPSIPIHEKHGSKFVTVPVKLKIDIHLADEDTDEEIYDKLESMSDVELRWLIQSKFFSMERTELGDEMLEYIQFDEFL